MKTIQELQIITKNAEEAIISPVRKWAKGFVESYSETIELAARRGHDNLTIVINESGMSDNLRWSYTNKEKQAIVAQEFAKYGFKVKCLTDTHRINVSWEEQTK